MTFPLRAGLALVFPLLFAFSGCSIDTSDANPFGAERGSASEQAIAHGSCTDSCGGESADGCWCDDACEQWGDCCEDYVAVCEAPAPVCTADSQCGAGETCVLETEGCCSGADEPCLMVWPVCTGTCEAGVDNTCGSDADCPNGYCESTTCAGLDCPTSGICITPDCDDDSAAVCLVMAPTCPAGMNAAIRTGCWECVDARTCSASCPHLICLPGSQPVDTDGDGCQDVCESYCPVVDCPTGTHAVDTDADSCDDICKPDDGGACLSDAGCGVGELCAVIETNGCCMPNELCEFAFPQCSGQCVPENPPQFDCSTNADCDGSMFCALENEETCGGPGLCRPLSEFCYQVMAPVCGCNGVTFNNDCYAHAAGVNVNHDGACDAPPPPAPDSCAESCGGEAPSGCWCDDQCASLGDCCADIGDVCPA